MRAWIDAAQAVSVWAIPLLLAGIPLAGLLRRVRVYEVFVEGAREGFDVALRIIPYLVAILTAIGMFRASGALEWLGSLFGPALARAGMPAEVLPLALIRPLSGGGSLGALGSIVKETGPDSLASRIAAVMFGSTETTFYVLAVYFGSVGIRRTRHALAAGLLADLAGMIAAVWIVHAFLGE